MFCRTEIRGREISRTTIAGKTEKKTNIAWGQDKKIKRGSRDEICGKCINDAGFGMCNMQVCKSLLNISLRNLYW